MSREFKTRKCNLNDLNSYKDIYGYTDEFTDIMRAGVTPSISIVIYRYLSEAIICRNNSIIPSRSEKRVNGIKWSVAWENFRWLKGMDSEELTFAWKLQQDLLPIGSRLHRQNAERRCLASSTIIEV